MELTALDDVPSPTSSNTLSQKSLSPDICTDSEIYSSSVINPTPQEEDYVEERDVNQKGCSRDQCDELKRTAWWPFKNEAEAELALLLHGPHPLVSNIRLSKYYLVKPQKYMWFQKHTFQKWGESLQKYVWYLLKKRDPSVPPRYKIKNIIDSLPGFEKPYKMENPDGIPYYTHSIIQNIRYKLAVPSTASTLRRFPEVNTDGMVREMYQAKKWLDDPKFYSPMIILNGSFYYVNEFVVAVVDGTRSISCILKFVGKVNNRESQLHALVSIAEVREEKVCFIGRRELISVDAIIEHYQGEITRDRVGWTVCGDRLVRVPEKTLHLLTSEHPVKKKAGNRRILNLPLLFFSDDVGGNTTNKWNRFGVWLFMLAGLPHKENNNLENIAFVNASNSVGALDLSKAILSELETLQEGVVMFDAAEGKEVMVVASVLCTLADNVRASELCSHLGCSSLQYCRFCDTTRRQVKENPLQIGKRRSTAYTMNAIKKIRLVQTEKTPYERLHCLLLGPVKDLTRRTFSNMSPEAKKSILLKIKAMNWKPGNSLGNISSNCNSFLGRDFKIWAQMAVFVLNEHIQPQERQLWLLLCKLFKELYSSNINAEYIAKVKTLVKSFLLKAKEVMPTLLNKSKVHMLQHLPEDLVDFGPTTCYSTERCESYMGHVRLAYQYTNRHSPSQDLAHHFARVAYLRFVFSGGFVHERSYMSCGPRLKELNSDPEVQQYLYSRNNQIKPQKGELRLLRKQATLKDDLSTAEELDVCRDFGEKQATFYGGISESDGGGVIHCGEYAQFADKDGKDLYGILLKVFKIEDDSWCLLKTFHPIHKYDKFGCSIFRLCGSKLVAASTFVEGATFHHCCEKTICRQIRENGQFVFQHDTSYPYYRLNNFIL
ncbi:uncharacterized protein [Ptychodera flava]|uniref:uncharacterized protein isoform X3 n=1 Tax=Ptychodera flava TaxID=63121 RepID=UPI00396A7837